MDHGDLQAVSNYYQISIHILTTNVAGMKEPRARWTHLSPDQRLKSFSTVPVGLPDMWLMHLDSTHFDLIVEKDSQLAKEGSIGTRMNDQEVTDKANICKDFGDSENDLGPGYMGWQAREETETEKEKETETETESQHKLYLDLKKAYNGLQSDYVQLKKDSGEVIKSIRQMQKEMKSLKAEYKDTVDALRKETHDKTKAETTARVLKDIIKSQEEDSEQEVDDSSLIEKMEVDEHVGVWLQQQKRKPIKIPKVSSKGHKCEKCEAVLVDENELMKHIIKTHRPNVFYACNKCENSFEKEDDLKNHDKCHSQDVHFNCDKCDKSFKNKSELKNHADDHIHSPNISYACNKCEKSFEKEDELKKHEQIHIQDMHFNCEICEKRFKNKSELKNHGDDHSRNVSYKCDKCDRFFNKDEELRQHVKIHGQDEISEARCSKCDKVYSNMSKLRRHDWRSHRQIDCNICGENLQSRQEISGHRKSVHQMYRKLKCRFYPDCIDENECFF